MKKIFYIMFLSLFILNDSIAQLPQQMNYQAVARNSSSTILVSQHISLRFSIRDGSPTASIVYQETDTTTTNQFGLFTTLIGNGNVTTGTFSAIAWNTGNKYLEVELDVNGGNNYSSMGTAQLVSVPYALYSVNSADGWNITGNSGTIDSLNFIGTVDDAPFNIRVNNKRAGRIESDTLYNTSFGYQALLHNTMGADNTAVGANGLNSNTIGNLNTAIGGLALYSNLSGIQNTAIGYQALYSNTVGNDNTATGKQALYTNTTGAYNTADGIYALVYNTSGIQNTAVGMSALYSNDTGNDNTAMGEQALYKNTAGNNNTAIGKEALYSNTTAVNNTAIGWQAMYLDTTGTDNTAVGESALHQNTTGASNVAFGNSALGSNTIGANNTAVGLNALYNNITGSYLTALGIYADVTTDGLTNATAIGYDAKVGASNSLVLGGTGINAVKVGIGTTTPASMLHISGGNIYIDNSANGVIMKSPNGQCWMITVSNAGVVSATSVTCP